MPLLEQEATRMAAALDDYEHVSVVRVAPRDSEHAVIEVTDERFDCDFEIASHCDYWDFVAAVVNHKQYVARPLRKEVA